MKIGFIGLLTLLFITLKLIKVITWSWVWVLSPLWIAAVLWVVVVFIMGFIMTGAMDALIRKWRAVKK